MLTYHERVPSPSRSGESSDDFSFADAVTGLERVAISVAAVGTVPEIVAAIASAARQLPGDPSVTVGVVTDGEVLRLAALEGFDPKAMERWGTIPLSVPVPLTDVLRSGEPMYLESQAQMSDRYPQLEPDVSGSGHHRWAAVPLRSPTGSRGAIGLAWGSETAFTDAERLYMQSLANLGGEALRRAGRDLRRRDLVIRLAESSDHERVEIARDLHDHSIQHLAAVLIKLGSLRSRHGDDDELEVSLHGLERDVQRIIESLRDIITELHPPDISGLSFADAVNDFVSWILAGTLHVTVTDGVGLTMSDDGPREAYRIVQEAVANVYKHAGATSLRIAVETVDDDWFRLAIVDDGVGMQPEARSGAGHLGLRTMRERAESVGGSLSISTAPGSAGTTVTAVLPHGRATSMVGV